jgi:hypothetical protein
VKSKGECAWCGRQNNDYRGFWCSKECADNERKATVKIAAVESVMSDPDAAEESRKAGEFNGETLARAEAEHSEPPTRKPKDNLKRSGDGWEGKVGGYAPVQGWGEVDGLPWYFRSRWDSWRFSIAFDPADNPVKVGWGEVDGWQKEGVVDGEELFLASWMPLDDAWKIITDAIAEFRESRKGV